MKNKVAASLAPLAVAAVAQAQEKRAASDPLANSKNDARDGFFTNSPDPWREVVKMKFGGDRTFASGLQRLILDADPSEYPALEKQLAAVLNDSACTDCAEDWVCRMLFYCGSPACVPMLAPLLEDDNRSDRARYALQEIPGAEVDAAFRGALPKLTGAAKAGLMGSIARRGDKQAIALLKSVLADKNESRDVSEAAERALVRLQNQP